MLSLNRAFTSPFQAQGMSWQRGQKERQRQKTARTVTKCCFLGITQAFRSWLHSTSSVLHWVCAFWNAQAVMHRGRVCSRTIGYWWILGEEELSSPLCVPTGDPTRLHWMVLLLMVIKTIWLNSVMKQEKPTWDLEGGQRRLGWEKDQKGFGIRTIRMLQYPCIKLS